MKYDAIAVAARVPADFISDGCSGAPDSICGRLLTGACWLHDAAMCSRLWPAGSLDQAWRAAADRQLGIDVRAALPFGLRWIGWLYWCAVHDFDAYAAFDSCGSDAGELCRHGQPQPEWMRAP